jgi:hypothetical protein
MNLYNSTITNNISSTYAPIFLDGGTTTIKNTIIYGNTNATKSVNNYSGITCTMTYCLYDLATNDQYGGFSATTGNINPSDLDPIFMNTSSDNYQIAATSPARDAGNTISGLTLDMNEVTRANSTTTGSNPDIGCYENVCTAGTYYVDDNSTTGNTWCTTYAGSDVNGTGAITAPYLTLSNALKNCGCPGSTIRVDKGTYTDKNLIVSVVGTSLSKLVIQGVPNVSGASSPTVFDGGGTGGRFMLINNSADYIDITDMVIQNYSVAGNGGGISLTTSGDNINLQDIKFSACKTTDASGQHGGGSDS